jgi:hypothetical protein
MAYTDFAADNVQSRLGVSFRPAELFPALAAVPVPDWLRDQLAKTRQLALLSEKSRSEFIVAPVLIAVRDLAGGTIAILSGQRLDVDAAKGLSGECDFLLSGGPQLPILQAPLLTVVEAKKHDIESGLGQCVAQMVAVRMFNDKAGAAPRPVFGCVTNGEAWQFLRLADAVAEVDPGRLYLDNVGGILAALLRAVGHGS